MSYKIDNNSVTYRQDGAVLGIVEFPEVRNHVVNINHTFVDDQLRGQGIASAMMFEVAKLLEKTDRKAKLSCSYARYWFDKHQEYSHLIYEPSID